MLYGRPTCEDTAITRERLRFLGVSFRELDIEQDTAAAQFVESVNGGHRVTPTIARGTFGWWSLLYRLRACVEIGPLAEKEILATGWDRSDYARPATC